MKSIQLLAVAFLALLLGGGSAQANSAHGDNRTVNVAVAGWWLHHTYEYVQYGTSVSGHYTYGGTASGCTNCGRYSTTSVYSNTPTCVAKQGNLTYAITGVCHQGTNRALQATSIPYVLSWNVGGGGTSNALYCTFGAGLTCYGSPC